MLLKHGDPSLDSEKFVFLTTLILASSLSPISILGIKIANCIIAPHVPTSLPNHLRNHYMDPSHEHIQQTLFSASPFTPATVDGVMTELSFAKSFLSLLDSRPVKLQADHVSPAQNLEITAPYTLPKMQTAMKKPSDPNSTGKEESSTVVISLKSSRNPVLGLTLPGMDIGVSILELKERVSKEIKAEGTEKIRVLYHKKPCSDSKTVKEVIGDADVGKEVEFGVMVMGYTASNLQAGGETVAKEGPKLEKEQSNIAQGPSGEEVLVGEEFWSDLKGFLNQRIRDEGVAEEVMEKFRGSWKGR